MNDSTFVCEGVTFCVWNVLMCHCHGNINRVGHDIFQIWRVYHKPHEDTQLTTLGHDPVSVRQTKRYESTLGAHI